jgi:hypothetical protein
MGGASSLSFFRGSQFHVVDKLEVYDASIEIISEGKPITRVKESLSQCPPTGPRKITIAHFNDVYNVEPSEREPVGGAARLTHLVMYTMN